MIAGFYTYIHVRADDGKVFYVGKGRGKRAQSWTGRNPHWLRIAKKHGLRVEIIATWPTEAQAFDHERMLIAEFRGAGLPLCNKTDGGEGAAGFKPSAETRAKLSAAGKGRFLSAAARLKISVANSGKKRTAEQRNANAAARRGRPLSAEHVAKISASNRGHVVSEATRAMISASRRGQVLSVDVRAKISAANRGRVRSSEFRAKVSAGLTGRPVSKATREKISAAHTGRSPSQEVRAKIAQTLRGRRLSDAEKERLRPLTHSPGSRAKHSAAMAGKPWSAARRAAQKARAL